MPQNDVFPIRVYFRDPREQQIAENILRPASGDDMAVYGASVEGRVTREGFARLLDQRLIVDSIATDVEPSTAPPWSPGAAVTAASETVGAASGAAIVTMPVLGTVANVAREVFRLAVNTVARYLGRRKKLPEPLEAALAKVGLSKADTARLFERLAREAAAFLERQAPSAQARARTATTAAASPAPSAQDGAAENIYEVTVRLPLRPEYRRTLGEIGGGITAYEPPNVFHLAGSSDDAARIQALPFVTGVARYGMEKTVSESLLRLIGVTPDETVAARTPESANASSDVASGPGMFEMVLHRDRDKESAKAMLVSFGCTLLAESATILRFEAPPDPGLLAALADRPEVKKLAPYTPPTLFSNQARMLAGVDRINARSNAPGVPLAPIWDGAGELVAVLDSGVDNTHPDLADRIEEPRVAYGTGTTKDDQVGHGTHVAGIIAGTGAASHGVVRGMAPAAKLVSFGIVAPGAGGSPRLLIPPDLGELLAAAAGRNAKIINLSWGTAVAAEYDRGASQLDKFVYDHPEVLVVVAAGNAGEAPDGRHRLRTLGAPATAKNALTVGACGSGRPGFDRTYATYDPPKFGGGVAMMRMSDPDYPAALGSRGPTIFESIKPDVSACGVYVLAPKAAHTNLAWEPACLDYDGRYAYLGGTSMAAPVVSGLAALVRQYLRVGRGVTAPSAALLKAILIAAAERSKALTANEGDPYSDNVGYPDFHQGFGRVDLSRVMAHAQMPPGRKLVFDDVANNSDRALRSPAAAGDKRYYSVTVAPDCPEPLRIVLTWTDYPGTGIQNNLNLWVDGPNRSVFIGNRTLVYRRDPIFDEVPRGGTPFDKHNNVEHLSIARPEAGEYIIRVVAQSTPMGPGQQGYALCVVGCLTTDLMPG